MRYVVSLPKAIISALTALFGLGYGIYYLSQSLWAETILFLALGILFLYQFYKNASYVEINQQSICLKFFGIHQKKLLWNQVQEVGLIGEAVFRQFSKTKSAKSGDKYIYFSPFPMNEQSRFQMIVSWPPRDNILYIEYKPETLENAVSFWNGPIKYYNVEDLYPNTKD